MSPDVPDKPVSFARLQQQMILTEVELMKLEDLREELQTQVDAANRLRLDMQRVADQACAERDHLLHRTTALEASLRQAQELLAREQALAAELQAKISGVSVDLGKQQALAAEVQAKLAAVESSASWRWTAPLRALGRLLGRRA